MKALNNYPPPFGPFRRGIQAASFQKLATLALGVCFATNVLAQISVVSQFTGALQEDFDSQPPVFNVPSVTVMGGELTISSATGELGIYNGGFLLGSKGNLVFTSPYAFGNDGDSNPFSIAFSTPVNDFGGLWNAASPSPTITFTFYDAANNLLGTDAWTTPNNNILDWRGWSSPVGIKRIDISGGESIPFDSFQADIVPEPTSLTFLGLGLMVLARRRNRSSSTKRT